MDNIFSKSFLKRHFGEWYQNFRTKFSNEKYAIVFYYNLWKILRNPETHYFVCPFGIGDTLYKACMVKAYKEKYGVKKICFIVKHNHVDLVGLFPSVDEIMDSSFLVRIMTYFSKKKRYFHVRNYHYGHMLHDGRYPTPLMFLGVKNIDFLDIYKVSVMCLSVDSPVEMPKIPSEDDSTGIYEKYKNEKALVMLMPYSASMPNLPDSFWELIVDRLLQMGYKVLTNVKDDSETVIKGTDGVVVSLKDFYILSYKLNWKCIATRSGICDLVGFLNNELWVITQQEYYPWKMGEMDLPNKNITDIVYYNDDTAEKNAESVINAFNAR